MLDIRFVRADPDVIREDLKKRNDVEKIAWVDDLLLQDIRHRELIGQTMKQGGEETLSRMI